MNAIILVGGLGTRLRPLTLTQPKALLPVLNKPFLSYQLDVLRQAGVRDVVLASGASLKKYERQIKTLAKGLRLHTAYEPSPLGTGGAIRFSYDWMKKRGLLQKGPVIVFNGDVFFDFDLNKFMAFHQKKKAVATILLKKVEDPTRFGVVTRSPNGQIKCFVEKPKNASYGRLINAGAYILEPSWVEHISTKHVVSIERESFPQALKRADRIFGFPMTGYWNDIGTPATYLKAHFDLLSHWNRWTRKKIFRKRGHLVLGASCRVDRNVQIDGFVCCGDRVVIEKGSVIKNCVLMSGTRVGRGVTMEDSTMGRDCRIGEFSKIGAETVLGDKTTIPPFTRC